MLRYAIKQLINMTLTLIAVSMLVFMLNEWTPGDVVSKLLGPYASQDQVEKVTREMGLDRPALVRYVEYMGRALTGDFGQSIVYRQPVANILVTLRVKSGRTIMNTIRGSPFSKCFVMR